MPELKPFPHLPYYQIQVIKRLIDEDIGRVVENYSPAIFTFGKSLPAEGVIWHWCYGQTLIRHKQTEWGGKVIINVCGDFL